MTATTGATKQCSKRMPFLEKGGHSFPADFKRHQTNLLPHRQTGDTGISQQKSVENIHMTGVTVGGSPIGDRSRRARAVAVAIASRPTHAPGSPALALARPLPPRPPTAGASRRTRRCTA